MRTLPVPSPGAVACTRSPGVSLSSMLIPLGAISVFSSTSISSTTSTRIGVSPAKRSVRVALTRTSGMAIVLMASAPVAGVPIDAVTVTVTRLSRTTSTDRRRGRKPVRVTATSWRPAGRVSRAMPLASVVALRPAACTRKSERIPIDSSTVIWTRPLSAGWARSGAARLRKDSAAKESTATAVERERGIGES